jgi:hypothetical protein
MAFYNHFTPSTGPNDLPTVQITPQQYAFALHQFQLAQQTQMTATTIPPHPAHLPSHVIDPTLLPSPPIDAERRILNLEREIKEIKAQKRTNSDPKDSSPKRRRRSQKPSPYILKDAKNLSSEQNDVRKDLVVCLVASFDCAN